MRGISRIKTLQAFDGGKNMTQMLQETKPLNLAWMTGWCGAVGLFGIILVGGGFEVTSGPVRILFDFLNAPGELDLNPYMRFSLAILGAVTIGWSLALMAVIQATNQLEKQVSKSIWIGITASIVIWYVIDSTLSIATGFWLNAVSNTIFSAAFLIPVIRSDVLRS
jgi:hypothetical protein